jgi:ribosomal protein L37E
MSRYVVDMCSRFAKQTVADLIKLAIREQCGKIVYREPTQPVKDCGWFSTQDVPMDWTSFETKLKHRCSISGLEFVSEKIRMEEWRPKEDQKDAG